MGYIGVTSPTDFQQDIQVVEDCYLTKPRFLATNCFGMYHQMAWNEEKKDEDFFLFHLKDSKDFSWEKTKTGSL